MQSLLPEAVYQRPGKGQIMYHYQRDLFASGKPPLARLALKDAPGLDRFVNVKLMDKVQRRYLADEQEVGLMSSTTSLALWLLYAKPDLSGSTPA